MFAKPNDTSKALILNPKSVHGSSRWTLRLDGGFLAIAGSFGLLADITGHFFGVGPMARDVRLALYHRRFRGARSGDHPRRLAAPRRQGGRPAIVARSRLERSPAFGHCQSGVLV